jgi:uncharacterized protein with HEPN domain
MPTHKKTIIFLADIDQAINEIFSFLPAGIDFIEYQNDVKTCRAVERDIGIIGEAVSQILKIDPQFPIENARKIVNMRNRVIHGYNTVSDEVIWKIIESDLPKLQKQVKEILNAEGSK